MDSLHKEIEAAITNATGREFRIAAARAVGGGCIHAAEHLAGTDQRDFFIKRNDAGYREPFECEAHALREMAATRTLRVPRPVTALEAGGRAVLVLEYLEMGGARQADWRALGGGLARMHRHTGADFGWDRDNWIGATPQRNARHDNWVAFYRACRLEPQVGMAREKGLRLRQAEELLDSLPAYFGDYRPAPSLLHGDLWAGNADFLRDGTPVVFDPACYHGDRETDLALTHLFGGYPAEFYTGYAAEWAPDPGHAERRELYNLYHVLNHFNIFGGGYGSQAEAMVSRLLQRARRR